MIMIIIVMIIIITVIMIIMVVVIMVIMVIMVIVMVIVIVIVGIIRLSGLFNLGADTDLRIDGANLTDLARLAGGLIRRAVTDDKRDIFCLCLTISDQVTDLAVDDTLMELTTLLYDI
jgi:hypothetical protein